MAAKSATYGRYIIYIDSSGTVHVYTTVNGEPFTYANTIGALREIADKIGFQYEKKWNTRHFGNKLVTYLIQHSHGCNFTPPAPKPDPTPAPPPIPVSEPKTYRTSYDYDDDDDYKRVVEEPKPTPPDNKWLRILWYIWQWEKRTWNGFFRWYGRQNCLIKVLAGLYVVPIFVIFMVFWPLMLIQGILRILLFPFQ